MTQENTQRFFITFEGGEGAGKTTQVERLRENLMAQGYDVVLTREPGGSADAEKIRALFVQSDGGEWSAMEELLLVLTARSSHLRETIHPALNAGKIVICDRYIDSTYAYQGHGRGLDLSLIKNLHDQALDNYMPDATIVLDIDPTEGLARSGKRLAQEQDKSKRNEDRFEQLDLSFHELVRESFLESEKQEPQRVTAFDAQLAPDQIEEQIFVHITSAIKKAG